MPQGAPNDDATAAADDQRSVTRLPLLAATIASGLEPVKDARASRASRWPVTCSHSIVNRARTTPVTMTTGGVSSSAVVAFNRVPAVLLQRVTADRLVCPLTGVKE